jgi:uncharacterized protein
MIYDNAQLIISYTEGYQITKNAIYERIVFETVNYMMRDMMYKDCAFYSAEDADSLPTSNDKKKVEG